MIKNKYKLLGIISIFSLSILALNSTDSNSKFFTQSSVEKLKDLNKSYDISFYPLNEEVSTLKKQLFMAGLLEAEANKSQKGLIASVEGVESNIFLLQPKESLSDASLEDIANDYSKIPEFEFVEVDQNLVLNESSELGNNNSEAVATLDLAAAVIDPNIIKEPIRVGVFDSGLDKEHPLFKNTKIDVGWDGLKNMEYATGDEIGHGTHVTGIIVKEMPSVEVVPYKITSTEGGRLSNLIIALQKGLDEGNLDVINMSFGFTDPSDILEKIIHQAAEEGIIMVAATGNKENSDYFYPAAYEEVIAVGAATRNGKTVSSSNFGEWVDIAALGHLVYSSTPNQGYSYKSGTSQAAAYVTAKVGNLLEVSGPMTNQEVIKTLNDTEEKVLTGNLKGISLIK